jgi:uncharacterized membrane protein YeiH
MRVLWWLAAVVVAALSALALWGAVAALRRSADFNGVLRLVVEAVAGGVVIAYCIGKARAQAAPAALDDDGSAGAGEGQQRQEGQRGR